MCPLFHSTKYKMAEEGKDGSDCITHSCLLCGQKLGTKEALQQHSETCKVDSVALQIKREPEEETSGIKESGNDTSTKGSPGKLIESTDKSACVEAFGKKQVTSDTCTSSQASTSCIKIKTEPCDAIPSTTDCSQNVVQQPFTHTQMAGQGLNLMPQPLSASPLVFCSPQISETTSIQTSQPMQVSQVRFPVQLTLSPKYHEASKNKTAFELLRQRFRGKNKATPTTSTVRSILPKAIAVSCDEAANGKSDGTTGKGDDNVPRIEKVYYTSKADCDPVGQIKIAENAFHPPPLSKEFKLVHSKQKLAKSHNADKIKQLSEPAVQSSTASGLATSVVKSQCQAGPVVTVSGVQPQQSISHSMQLSQRLQCLPQNVPQTPPALIPAPLGLAPTPQGMLPCSQFTNMPSLLQNNNMVQQFLPPPSLVVFQPAQRNIVQNPVIPLLTPQPPACGVNVLPSHSSSVLLPACTAVTTAPSDLTPQTICSTTSAITVSKHSHAGTSESRKIPASSPATSSVQKAVTEQKLAAPVPLPVATLPQVIGGGISPAQSPQVAQNVLPNQATKVVWLPCGVSTSSPQNLIQFPSPMTANPLLMPGTALAPASQPTPSSVPGSVNVAANVVKQNPQSNIVLLPPVTPQGHILNGIRIEGPLKVPPSTDAPRIIHVDTRKGIQSVGVQTGWETVQTTRTVKTKKTNEDSSAGKTVSVDPGKKSGMVLIQPKDSSMNVNVSQDASWLTLKFQVEGSKVDHHTAAQVVVLTEYKVSQIAKMVLFGTVREHSPVILDDGRPFLPVVYTGPYIPKDPKTFVRKKDANLPVSEKADILVSDVFEKMDKSVSAENLDGLKGTGNSDSVIQTVKLLGKVVWLFLDYDGPKILWKLEPGKGHMLALPLERKLPEEVLNEIRIMLLKYRLKIPPHLDPFCPKLFSSTQAMKSDEKANASTRLFTLKNASPNSRRCIQRLPKSSQKKAKGTSKLPGTSRKRRRKAKLQQPKRGLQQHKRVKSSSPQLIVRERADVIQRALEAVVCVQRLPLTESLQQQLRVLSRLKNGDGQMQSLECIRTKSPVKAEHSETVQGMRGDNAQTMAPLEAHEENQMLKRNSEDDFEKKCPEQENPKEQNFNSVITDKKVLCENDENTDSVSDFGPESNLTSGTGKLHDQQDFEDPQQREETKLFDTFEEQMHAKRRNRKRPAVDSGVERPESGSSELSGKEVRRSYRILCRPKTDYKLKEHRYDYLEENGEVLTEVKMGDAPRKAQRKTDSNPVVESKRTVPYFVKGYRRSGFDVYIDKGASLEEEHGTHDDNPDQDMEGSDDSLTDEQFLKVHSRHVKELVLKKAKALPDSKKRVEGHVLYLCVICGSFQSLSMNEITGHLKEHYSGELNCQTCDFRAAYKQELMEHEALEHTGKPLYHCDVCSTSFFSKAVFLNHVKRHKTSTSCKTCSVSFPSKQALQVHEEAQKKMFVCHMCFTQFKNESTTRLHYKYCLNGYQCCLCYVKKTTVPDLTSHMEEEHSHHGPLHICSFEHCGATFLTKEELGSHTSEHVPTLYFSV
ncbi:uncharacterized protein LOC143294680 isoform X2 [Babylonia areolata]|uniref:uncharacterized protein LOC143294680 isoform X2 n=2 Tax=Babylonia areolata TaxID=304850 RepID=UPI003FD177EB